MDDGTRHKKVQAWQECRVSAVASYFDTVVLDWPDEWFDEEGDWILDDEQIGPAVDLKQASEGPTGLELADNDMWLNKFSEQSAKIEPITEQAGRLPKQTGGKINDYLKVPCKRHNGADSGK